MSRKQYPFSRKIKVHYFPDYFTMTYHFMGRFFLLCSKVDFSWKLQVRWLKKRKNKVGVVTQLCQHTFNLKNNFFSNFISKFGLSSVGAARKVSPNCSQEKMTFFQLLQYSLGLGLGTIGDFSSEQLLHDPLASLFKFLVVFAFYLIFIITRFHNF